MPGISGVLTNREPFDETDKITEKLITVQTLREVKSLTKQYQSESCVIVNMLTGLLPLTLEQPFWDEQQNVVLFLEGEIYNWKTLFEKAKQPLGSDPLQVLLSLYFEQGPTFVSLVEGTFNIAIYEKNQRCLTLLNDRFASKAMYFLEENGSFLFASEKKSILAVRKNNSSLDALGLLEVFAYQHNLLGRTFIQGLKSLPPGSILRYCDGRISQSCYHQFSLNPQLSLPSMREAIEKGGYLLQESIKTRLSGKERSILLLSGGLDSRAIACAIPSEFIPNITTFTFGKSEDLDVIYGSLIAKRLGFNNHVMEENTPYSDIIHKVVWRTECAFGFQHCRSITFHEFLKNYGDFILGGQLGDISSGGHILPYMLEQLNRATFINNVFQHYSLSSKILSRIFQSEFLQEQIPNLKEAFRNSFEALEADNNISLYEEWDLTQRQANFILQAKLVDSHQFEFVFPFLDYKYIEFMLSLPLKLRQEQYLYKEIIYELGKQIRDVPNANNNLKLRQTALDHLIKRVENKVKYITQKLKRRLTNSPPPPIKRKSRIAGDLQFRHCIENFVNSDHCDSSIFNREGILKALEDEWEGKANNQDLLCTLATFAVGIPYFIDNRTLNCPEEAEPIALLSL